MKSQAPFYAGTCYDLRGKGTIALRRYEEAFRDACRYEIDEWDKSDKPRNIGQKIGVTAAVTTAPVTTIGGAVIVWGIAAAAAAGPVGLIAGAIVGAAISGSLPSAGRGVGGYFASRRQKALTEFHELFVIPLAILLGSRLNLTRSR